MEGESDAELLSEYNFLIEHTPRGLYGVQKKVFEEIVKMRQFLIRDQRVSFSFLYTSNINSLKFGQLKKVFNPKVINKRDLPPSISQQSNLFLSYLYSNIGTLANAVVKFHKHDKFSHLVNISIPSVFSNFTSYESVEVAYVFYLYILSGSQPDLAIKIIAPFFNSMLSFRYIENIMTKFLPKFAVDKRTMTTMKPNVVAFFQRRLFSLINGSVSLLPMKIVTLFHPIGSMKWTVDDLAKLFIDKFFAIQAEAYIKASPYSLVLPQFKAVLKEIRNSSQCITRLFQTLTSFDASLNIPHIYRPLGENYITCLVSAEDLTIVGQCLQSAGGDLPYTVRELDLKMEKMQTPYYVNFYPKQTNAQEEPFKTLIFEKKNMKHPENPVFERMYQNILNKLGQNSEEDNGVPIGYEYVKKESNDKDFIHFALQASVCDLRLHSYAFELLLWHRMHASIIKEWLGISWTRTRIYKKSAIIDCPLLPPDVVFETYTDVFGSHVAVQPMLVKVMIPLITEAIQHNKSDFEQINAAWKTLLSKKKEVIDTSNIDRLSESVKTIFWDAVQILNTADSVSLDKRFFVIFDALVMLNQIPLERKTLEALISDAVTFSAPESLLSSFILLTAFVMRDSNYISTIREIDLQAWTRFESIMLKYVMSKDFPDLQLTVLKLQGNLYSFNIEKKR